MVQKSLARGLIFSICHDTLIVKATDSTNSFVIPSKNLNGFTHYSQMISKIKEYIFGNPEERVSLFIEPEAYSFMENACDSKRESY